MASATSNPSSVVSAGAWTSGANVYSSNDTYATNTGSVQNTEYPLDVGGFNFSAIPAGSTIDSVTVTIEAKTGTANRAQIKGELYDNTTLLSGALALTNLTAADANYTFTPTATLAQLKSANLKVRVVNKRIVSQASTTSVDYVKIDVVYTAAGVVHQASGTTAVVAVAAGNVTIGTPGFSLADIPGLAVWVDADDLPETVDGTIASPVPVRAGAPMISQGVRVLINGKAGHKAFVFDPALYGGSQALDTASTVMLGPDVTMLAVVDAGAQPVDSADLMDFNHSGGGWVVQEDAANAGMFFAWRVGTFQTTESVAFPGRAHIVQVWKSGGSGKLTIDGVERSLSGASGIDAHTLAFRIGNYVGGGGRGLTGKVSMVAAWPRALTTTELEDALEYLNNKWFPSIAASGTTAIVSGASGDGTVFTPPICGWPSAWTTAWCGDAGGVTHQASGTTAIVSGAQGTVTAAHQASGTTPIVSGASALTSAQRPASGLNAIVSGAQGSPTARFQASGTTPIVSGASGVVLVPGASGVTPIVSGAQGDVTARHQVSGTTAIVSGAQGTVGAGVAASGTTPIVSGAQGTATSQQPVGGTNPIVSSASGDVAARHQVSGTTAIVSGASGAVLGLGSAGQTNIVSGASGDVTARHQASATTAIVSGAQGDAPKRTQASGQTNIVSGASGDVTARHPATAQTDIVSSAQGTVTSRVNASGTTPIVSGASGAVSPTGSTSGTTAIVSGASGSPTASLRVSGTTAIQSGASGAAGAGFATSGQTNIISGAQGAAIAVHSVSGTTAIVAAASGSPTTRFSASATTAIVSGAAGQLLVIYRVSGTTVILSGASGAIVVIGMPGSGGFPRPPIYLYPEAPILDLTGAVTPELLLTGASEILDLEALT